MLSWFRTLRTALPTNAIEEIVLEFSGFEKHALQRLVEPRCTRWGALDAIAECPGFGRLGVIRVVAWTIPDADDETGNDSEKGKRLLGGGGGLTCGWLKARLPRLVAAKVRIEVIPRCMELSSLLFLWEE